MTCFVSEAFLSVFVHYVIVIILVLLYGINGVKDVFYKDTTVNEISNVEQMH